LASGNDRGRWTIGIVVALVTGIVVPFVIFFLSRPSEVPPTGNGESTQDGGVTAGPTGPVDRVSFNARMFRSLSLAGFAGDWLSDVDCSSVPDAHYDDSVQCVLTGSQVPDVNRHLDVLLSFLELHPGASAKRELSVCGNRLNVSGLRSSVARLPTTGGYYCESSSGVVDSKTQQPTGNALDIYWTSGDDRSLGLLTLDYEFTDAPTAAGPTQNMVSYLRQVWARYTGMSVP
jgi:hypothetical protein